MFFSMTVVCMNDLYEGYRKVSKQKRSSMTDYISIYKLVSGQYRIKIYILYFTKGDATNNSYNYVTISGNGNCNNVMRWRIYATLCTTLEMNKKINYATYVHICLTVPHTQHDSIKGGFDYIHASEKLFKNKLYLLQMLVYAALDLCQAVLFFFLLILGAACFQFV